MMPMLHAAMTRRAFACGLGGLVAGLPKLCPAQSLLNSSPREPWKFIPSVVVISDPGDPRLPAVQDAVDFWNNVFLGLGSSFRLGSLAHIADADVVDQIRWNDRRNERALDQLLQLSRSGPHDDRWRHSDRLFNAGVFRLLAQVTNGKGDVIVALSSGERSFTIHSHSPRKAVLVIERFETYQTNPPTTLNGAQDTIAHEFGHAIGLGHNDDPTSLMCRPCRFPTREGFGPLIESEKALLLKMYPPSWREDGR